MPGRAFVVRNHAVTITGLTETVILRQVFPCQHVAVSVAWLICEPCPRLNLEHRVVAVHAEEIVHCGLSVILHLPALLNVDIIHQIDGPKIVIDLGELII